ncbi:long-chain-fatty-acid--CoA ligase [Streptomyces antnestii]|uniref:Long-chain-fatty-acid--CoA ligase n=2 Tax=Streptomyces antnestii TaxID=2494256 RepID=A0A3S2XT89_9ACTN|nr:long-chain-fatty-acid--CoA ligase [Streptomyces sp. San01]
MPAHLSYPEASVGDLLAGSARRYPDRVALRDGDHTLTFAELHEQALRFARGLRERGITEGDVVALHQPNSLWFPVTYYGILLAGAVVAPVNPTLPAAALRAQLDEAGARAVVTHPATAATLREAGTDGLEPVVLVPPSDAAPGDPAPVDGTVPLAALLAGVPEPGPRVSPDAVAHLSFTGGTTGRSKAVEVRHRHVVANCLQFTCWRAAALPAVDLDGGVFLDPVDGAATEYITPPGEGVSIAVAPFFHAMGLVGQSIGVLSGTTVVLCGRFEPGRFLDQAEKFAATAIAGSPALFHALLAAPSAQGRALPTVRVVNSGAAPIDTTTLRALRTLFPRACVVEGYGLTEATMGVTSGITDPDDLVPIGSVGLPVFDTDVEIRDLVDTGRCVPDGETGELWARGPQITAGYPGHPELTAEQFVDGWLRTGDLARCDERGHVYIVGRAKDMLIYKGYNVYPGQLEEILSGHPAVAQVSVVGVPSAEAGEIPVAYVVARADASPGAGPALGEELMAHVSARVAPYQRVREVRFLDALPTSAAGKILKAELRRTYRPSA